MKLFEYLAIGKSIVAAHTPAIAEVVSESDVVFYEPDNVESLVIALRTAVSQSPNPSASEKLTRYTWQNRAAEVLEFLKTKSV
jgi:glycosyltransferase involved in cell wall biosynthesis